MVILLSVISGCPDKKQQELMQLQAEAPVIVYKTRQDYRDKVPVLMNMEKTLIVAYPAPGDLYFEGRPSLPVTLEDGYLLDNRGLSPNSAFLKISYKEYAAMTGPPDPGELLKNILDTDPFTEMYHCGTRSGYKDIRKDLKRIIRGNFEGCTRLK